MLFHPCATAPINAKEIVAAAEFEILLLSSTALLSVRGLWGQTQVLESSLRLTAISPSTFNLIIALIDDESRPARDSARFMVSQGACGNWPPMHYLNGALEENQHVMTSPNMIFCC